MYLTKGVLVWLVLNAAIVTMDGTYLLNMPDTLPGGKWSTFFAPYTLYTPHDALYAGKVDDFFGKIVGYLNLG